MLLTLGAIDKASHMWGGITDTAAAPDDQAHLPFIARTADEQVGRIVQRLRELGQLDETLIVLTTDHAGQPSQALPRRRRRRAAATSTGTTATTLNGTFLAPSPALAAADRHRQRALQLPGLRDPHVADRHVRRREAQRRARDGGAART